MKKAITALAVAGLGWGSIAVPAAHAAVISTYADLASFTAAAAGPLQLQDFDSYAAGTDLSGVAVLPGVSATTNMDTLEAFSGGMFGIGGRASGVARYDIALSLPYTSFAFDIRSFEADAGNSSTAQGPGQLVVFFADATSNSFDISGNPNGDSIFFGVVSDTAITALQWNEALEGNGGNEETALDNFRVGPNQVPAPTTLALLGLGLAGLGWQRRKT